ncbi:transposase [Bradyrhizobium sp. ORS 86]|uniref:transposase n=1 Tax=unclassified Bradyrhizobium TaxID=2631580 RepID=UPI00388F8E17
MSVASGVAAAVGDIRRVADPTRLVSYLGLNPVVRQSGEGRLPWQDHQAGPPPSSRNARRSSMGCRPFAGTATCILPACGFTTRQAHRGSRDGAEACDDHLAYADQ